MRRPYFPFVAAALVAVLYGLTPLARIAYGTAYHRASVIVSEGVVPATDGDTKALLESVPAMVAKVSSGSGFFEWIDSQRHPASAATYVRTSRSPRPPPPLRS